MFDRGKQCKFSHKMMLRLNNFLYVFNLRQGTILIAVHQIALSFFVLIILFVGVSHAGEMLSMLRQDMQDDAERRGFYEILNGDQPSYHEGEVLNTNNQRRFENAQKLASGTVVMLYTAMILMFFYMVCCVSLLHGAVKSRFEYVAPWIFMACFGVVALIAFLVVGDSYPCIVNLFGGHRLYHFGCALFVITFIYAICAVTSFAFECASASRYRARARASDERGERLLLLDHAANSNLVSAAQFNKLSHGTRSQFV